MFPVLSITAEELIDVHTPTLAPGFKTLLLFCARAESMQMPPASVQHTYRVAGSGWDGDVSS